MEISLRVFKFDSIDHVFYTDSQNCIWVKASPIAEKLGFKRPEVAVVNNVDPDYRSKISTGVGAASWFINEPGFYQITFASQHPDAKRFQRWVFEEVLPFIRKQGAYISPDATQDQLKAIREEVETRLLTFETAYEVAKEMGDDRGMIEARSHILNLANTVNKTNAEIPEGWLTVSEILERAGYKLTTKELKTSLNQIGRKVRPIYETETSTKVLVTQKHLNSGHSGEVKLYPPEWFDRITAIALEYWKAKKLI